jgi:hypothetical protein
MCFANNQITSSMLSVTQCGNDWHVKVNGELKPKPFSPEKGRRPQGAELSKEDCSDTGFQEEVLAYRKPMFSLSDT